MIPLYISEEPYSKQFLAARKAWSHIKRYGNDSGCWSDGMCMNLIRLKMIRLRKLQRVEVKGEELPGWDIPEKVNFDYNHRAKRRK